MSGGLIVTQNHSETLSLDGKPVVYNSATGTVTLGEQEMTIDEWLEFRRRIDLIVKRLMSRTQWQETKEKMATLDKNSRLPTTMREHQTRSSYPAGNFFVANLEPINRQKRGRMKRAPWYLRWFYDAVVTKEALNADGQE